VVLHGTYEARNRFKVTSHAPTTQAEAAGDGEDAVAHYPRRRASPRRRSWPWSAATAMRVADVVEPLPARLRAREALPDRPAALTAAHFGDLEGGRRRLAFEELLLTQLDLLRRRARRRESLRAPCSTGRSS
jgi:ATP-dependent DNA helicase RecG